MRGIRIFGEYVMEIVIITLLVAISALTIVMFIPVLVGLNSYFKNKKDVRLYKDIFITIKENYKILIFYTIFQLLIIVFPVLNIYYFNTHPENMNFIILSVSYVALVIGAIYLTTAPTIIVNMNVTFFQLLRNGFMLLFGSILRSIISLLIMAGVVMLVLYYPYALVGTLYVVPLAITRLMLENFYVLKARALGMNVYQVKQKETSDDYLDEYGRVVHEEENGGTNEED